MSGTCRLKGTVVDPCCVWSYEGPFAGETYILIRGDNGVMYRCSESLKCEKGQRVAIGQPLDIATAMDVTIREDEGEDLPEAERSAQPVRTTVIDDKEYHIYEVDDLVELADFMVGDGQGRVFGVAAVRDAPPPAHWESLEHPQIVTIRLPDSLGTTEVSGRLLRPHR
jgi:hypothetical protein